MREGLLVTLFLLALTPQLGVSESFLKARLDKAVERSITSHSELTGYDLTIDARHGRVTLSGSVPSQEVGQRIVQIAQETNGVSSVDNQLVVVSREVTTLKESNSPVDLHPKGISRTDRAIEVELRQILQEQGFENSVDARVQDGFVELSGDLPTFRKVDELLSNFLMVRGVKDIKSSLTVAGQSYPEKVPLRNDHG
ncbi:MAG: BON domain-containing protein [Bdellovibrionales bacterium]|nr:BON domain-containing protein [Bdellovibrionales bacterium]